MRKLILATAFIIAIPSMAMADMTCRPFAGALRCTDDNTQYYCDEDCKKRAAESAAKWQREFDAEQKAKKEQERIEYLERAQIQHDIIQRARRRSGEIR